MIKKEEYLKLNLPVIKEYDDKYDKETIEKLEALTKQNDLTAMYELAARLCTGENIEKDIIRVKELLNKIIENVKHLPAIFWLGRICSNSDDESERVQAVNYYEIGSALGDGDCSEYLADKYRYGDGVEEDIYKAIELYTKAISQGNKNAYLYRGEMYLDNEVIGGAAMLDFLEAFSEPDLKGQAAYRIGQMFHEGWEVEKNNNKAVKFLEIASEEGIKEANAILGFIKGMGLDGKKDIDKAFEYLDMMDEEDEASKHNLKGRILFENGKKEEAIKELKIAVDLGSEAAKEMLMIIEKEEISTDYKNANIEELISAYKKGDKKTTYIIARAYRKGERGATKNIKKAIDYYNEILNYEDDFAKGYAYSDLGEIFFEGELGTKEYEKAYECAKKSLEYGSNLMAYYILVQIYDKGLGIEKNYEKAKAICKEAIEKTDDGKAYALYANLLCRGTIKGDQAKEINDVLKKCLEKIPNNSFANHYMGQFYLYGIKIDEEEKYEKNVYKAIEYFEKADSPEDYLILGDVYSKEEHGIKDYRKAIDYYKKAWEKGNLFGAAQIAGLELTSDFENEDWRNEALGIRAAKDYIFNGNDNNLKIQLLMLIDFNLNNKYKIGNKKEAINEYILLFEEMHKIKLKVESDENYAFIKKSLSDIVDAKMISAESQEEIITSLEYVEGLMEKDNTINLACMEIIGENYYLLGKAIIDSKGDLSKAKLFMNKSCEYGKEEGGIWENRIQKNIFGKWILR